MTSVEPKAVVFDVQRFSVHDGPGIRTVVFFKGCALDCEWCHNPEALHLRPELAYHADRCVVGCNSCLAACPQDAILDRIEHRVDFAKCTHCGLCVDPCPSNALVQIGREVTVSELLAEAVRDRDFFEASGGGVTLSGGEPLLHRSFLAPFLRGLRDAGIHTCVETAGSCGFDRLEPLLPWIDLVLYDVKVIDAEAHRRFTGRDNGEILRGLARVVASGTPVEVRMPVVPGRNTGEENVAETCAFLAALGVGQITLLPYNHFWEAKLDALDTRRKPLGIHPPGTELYEELSAAFARSGIVARC